MAKKFQPRATHSIQGEAAAKAYLHPVRMRIMSELVKEQQTVSGVARVLKVHPANITHHFRKLEDARLIKLVEKRDTGRNLEKYYRAVAMQFELATETAGGEGEVQNAVGKVLTFLRDDLSIAINQLKGDDSEDAFGLLCNVHIRPEDFRRFTVKLDKLMQEFTACDDGKSEPYSLSLGLYPNKRDYGPTKKLEIRKKKRSTK